MDNETWYVNITSMNLDQFSLLLTIGSGLLLYVVVTSMIIYALSSKTRERMHNASYYLYMKLMGLVAITATVCVLIYQYVYETPVCEYCWWQRIFMFPIDIVVLASIFLKIRKNQIITGVLATIGLVYAIIHYWYHYQSIILNRDVDSGCSIIGITPSCTESSVLIFGFVTIPLMAVFTFISIIWLSYLAHKAK